MTVSDMVPKPELVAEGQAKSAAPMRRSARPLLAGILIAVALLSTVAFEYGVYQHYFKRYVAPYYPVNDDQLETYQWAYNNSVTVRTGTLRQAEDKAIALPQSKFGMNMKGPLIPMLSLGATLLLGPHRFSVALVNLLYLIVGQIALFFALRRRSGMRAALIGSGLFLLSESHYFYAGGLNDMRLDYAGMIMMGLTYLAVLQWLEGGKRRDLVVAAICLLLCSLTRSIVLIYWVGTILSALVIFGSAALFDQAPALKQFRNRTAAILACVGAVGAIYVTVNWHDFATYYINCKTSGEDAMRRRENHIENIAQLLMYYPKSFWQHFQIMLVYGFGACVVTVLGFVAGLVRLGKGQQSPTQSTLDSGVLENPAKDRAATAGAISKIVTPPAVLFFSVVAAVTVCVISYVPSPLVIGVLTMPVCITLALAIERLMQLSKRTVFTLAIAASVAVCGLCHFNNEFRYPLYIPHQDIPEATTVNHIFEVLLPRVDRYHRPIQILWSLVHGGLNQRAFEIYSWEHRHKPLAVPVDASIVYCYPSFSWNIYAQQLKDADIVVAPVELAAPTGNEFEYDGMKSMRENLPKMRETLKADGFVQLGTYQMHEPNRPPVIGVFQKETY
ncbi:MAG TPA: hypothetical protein V6C69_16640 [Trichormus sp.]|jgi:hypothetical protein